MPDPRFQDYDALLRDTRWLKRLARGLAGDPHLAEDLAQDAWVAALENPPARGRPLAPWLGGILRHLASKARRADARRKWRESNRPGPAAAQSAAELVERAAMHRDLVEAVMELEELYRTVLLMHYLEELSPRVIAAHLCLPVHTVHTRLSRGLERLRRRFADTDGDRGAGLAALLAPLPGTPTFLSATMGALVMNANWMKALAAVVLLSLLGVYGTAFLTGPAREEAAGTPVATSMLGVPGLQVGDGPGEPTGRATIEAAERVLSLLASPDPERDLHGIVVTSIGEPIPDAEVHLTFPALRHVPTVGEWNREEHPVVTQRTNERGEFLIPLVPGRTYDLKAVAEGRASTKLPGLYAGEFVRVELGAQAILSGRITVGDDSSPVSGARVSLSPGIVQPWGNATYEALTDGEGKFRVDRLPAGVFRLTIESDRHPKISRNLLFLEEGDERRLDLVLQRGTTISGCVTDGETHLPIAGARVGLGEVQGNCATTDDQGNYVVQGVQPGDFVDLCATAPGYGQWQVRTVPVTEVGLTQDLFLLPSRRAQGRIVDSRGTPLPDVFVSAQARAYLQNDCCLGRSDADGRFELNDLRVDLRHTLLIRAAGFATAVYDFPATEWESRVIDFGEIRLAAPGTLGGRLVDSEGFPLEDLWVLLQVDALDRDRFGPADTGGVREGYAVGEGHGTGRVGARTDARGRFFFEDLPAGSYYLSAGAKGFARRGTLEVDLDEGEVRDDLELVCDVGLAIEGVLVDSEGNPLPGLAISVYAAGKELQGRLTYNLARGEGAFSLRGLDPGSYDLQAGPGQSWDQNGTQIVLGKTRWEGIQAGSKSLRLVVSSGAYIEGSIVDPDGEPVPGCSVIAMLSGQDQTVYASDSEGRFRFLCPEGEPVDLVAFPSVSGVPGVILDDAGRWDESYNGILKGVLPCTPDLVIQLPKFPPHGER